jgi:hypothetical protein
LKIYVAIVVDEYIPTVELATPDKTTAVQWARAFAGNQNWYNAKESEIGEVYFNQEEQGDMANAISVQEVESNVNDIELALLYQNVERRLSLAIQPETMLEAKNELLIQARNDLRKYMCNNGFRGNF